MELNIAEMQDPDYVMCPTTSCVREFLLPIFTLGFLFGIIYSPKESVYMNLSRLESLVGEENIHKISKLKVLILGLGGVGGYTVESITRCGVENITLVDGDTIKPSNINRQIIATSRNNNRY